ncbi:MAG TPA: YbhB/YbcL family Raf kinase inhibitor-like protein, partial [Polyangiales bacterium]|nr:YbhB/YbcL family Raf kinase inhibitor-like protein [Polyangiales bacterium]
AIAAFALAQANKKKPEPKYPSFKLESSAFGAKTEIPTKHTCEGADVAPALSWAEPPAGTKSFVLIVDDPDAPDPAAPQITWVHWVLFNIPKSARSLPEGAKPLPTGSSEGLNDWKAAGYRGPCPPTGRHRYFHKLYALDTELALMKPTKADLEAAIDGHVLAKGELIGTYQKTGKKP